MSEYDIDKMVENITNLSFKEYLRYKGRIIKTKEEYHQMVREEMRDPYAKFQNSTHLTNSTKPS